MRWPRSATYVGSSAASMGAQMCVIDLRRAGHWQLKDLGMALMEGDTREAGRCLTGGSSQGAKGTTDMKTRRALMKKSNRLREGQASQRQQRIDPHHDTHL